MPRKLKDALLADLKTGKYKILLDYIKSDHELRIEIRKDGGAYVYYKKGKSLVIGHHKLKKADEKYGDVPSLDFIESKPSEYFLKIKDSINNWLNDKKERAEFDTQQNIAAANQEKEDRYIIIDMEYRLEQDKIEKAKREKGATFDLLGIERKTGRIFLFEVKTGLLAIGGKAGIDKHIEDFDKIMKSENKKIYMENLVNDVNSIISNKIELGIIKDFKIPENLTTHDPELGFIFHSKENNEIDKFKEKLAGRKKMITISNDFKLR